MRRALTWAATNIQAILAFSLLAFQVWIPWTVPDFVTEDGPSHLYTAVVARNLLLNPHSEYVKVYALNHQIVPNWGTTIVLGVIASVAGVAHAEQLFITLALIAGFFAFAYAIRSVAPDAARWTPLTNFLLQSWFLWLGFYNLYLAMVLCPLLIGYYMRHASAFTRKRAAALACGITALYLTHLIPAILAGQTIVLIAVWGLPMRIALRRLMRVAVVFAPVLILFGWFALSSREHVDFNPKPGWALENFPMHVFTTSSGRAGNQDLLYPAVLCLIVVAIAMMRRAEWRTAQGGVAISTVVTFLLYLFVPDSGLGGKEAKIRFAWGVFMLGGLLLATVPRLRPLRLPLDIYIFALLIATLVSTQATLWNYNDAVEDYLSATRQIPKGARLVRLRYPTPDIPERYGFQGIGRDPLFHLDSYVAVRRACLNLTDYQAPSNIFPVVFGQAITDAQRWALWSFEWPGADMDHVLTRLQSTLPVEVDYVIVVADQSTPGFNEPAFTALLRQLNTQMRLMGTSGDRPFVRVYQRTAGALVSVALQ